MTNYEDIDFEEFDDSRNVYIEPDDRALIRTKDVYQTELDNGVDGYSETLLAIVANFKNGGKPKGFNVQSMVGRSKRGEVALRLFAVVDDSVADPIFVKVGFKTRGCLAMTGCASAICSLIEGKTFSQALAVTTKDVERAVDGVPSGKRHTLMFAVEAVRALVGDWMYRAGMTLDQMDAQLPCDNLSVECLMCEHCSLRDTRIDMMMAESQAKQETADTVEATPQPDSDTNVDAEAETTPQPDADTNVDAEAAARELAEHNALADVFDDVTRQSANSKLVTPDRWADLGLIPDHFSAEEFEMFVYEWLENYRVEHAEEIAAEIAAEKAKAAAIHSATRAVGVPPKIPNRRLAQIEADKKAAEQTESIPQSKVTAQPESIPQPKSTAQPEPLPTPQPKSTAQPESLPTPQPEATSTASKSAAEADDPFANLNIPAGYRLEEIEGEWVLVQDENAEPVRKEIHCNRIKALVGLHSYYLYDETKMTDSYARWAFLAAEDNPQVTFVECVREDSRVYPRPYAAECLKNPPFKMTDEQIEQTWQAVRDSGNFPDIQRTEASNGDIYYYSTDYLEPTYATSLAEYDAVERPANV